MAAPFASFEHFQMNIISFHSDNVIKRHPSAFYFITMAIASSMLTF
jgi:hypothetical protein